MFYLLIILALAAYSIQGILLFKYARALDGFQVSMYRGISLILIMTPLLIWAPKETYGQLLTPQNIGLLSIAGITGYLGHASSIHTSKYLPIGILESLNASGKGILYVLVGVFIQQEIITVPQVALIAVIIAAAIILTTSKSGKHSIEVNIPKGLLLLFFSITFSVATVSIMGNLSESINPFTVGYFWEVFIGLSGVLVILVSSLTQKKPFPRISWQNYKKIFWASSPTLIGTGCLSLALSMGPISIGGAIMTGGVFVSTLLAWLIYHEKPSKLQWLLIAIIVGAIAGLKILG